MAENKNIEVGGRLHSIATGNVLAGANEIFDDDKNKKQSEINTETYSLVNDVNERLNGLSPDQQSALSVAEKATNNETKLGYYVCDIEGNVAKKVISDATGYVLSPGGSMKVKMTNANTADNATLNINSTGAKALYYAGERASASNTWDAGETVEVYYDGTSYYANNVAGGSGSGDGAFDVSAKYPTSGVDGGNTYTLAGALAVLNANLSASKKKGGMSIKFISSDNKYVQYRLMSDTFNTTVANWQGVDDEPTAGSDNLVKSGGAYLKINQEKQRAESVEQNLQGNIDVIKEETLEENREMVNSIMQNYAPVEIIGDVNNAPDEEDLTSVNVEGTDVLKFKDKVYNPLVYSGLGRKILRKNIVNGVNTLTQSMMQADNTIYVIQYDFTLGGNITIPANCVLEFDGGSLSGDSKKVLTLDKTLIIGAPRFDISNFSGTILNDEVHLSWFTNGMSSSTDYSKNDHDTFIKAMKLASRKSNGWLNGDKIPVFIEGQVEITEKYGSIGMTMLYIRFRPLHDDDSLFYYNSAVQWQGSSSSITDSIFTCLNGTNNVPFKDVCCIRKHVWYDTNYTYWRDIKADNFTGYFFLNQIYLQEVTFENISISSGCGFIGFNSDGHYAGNKGSCNVVHTLNLNHNNGYSNRAAYTSYQNIFDFFNVMELTMVNTVVQGLASGTDIKAISVTCNDLNGGNNRATVKLDGFWVEYPAGNVDNAIFIEENGVYTFTKQNVSKIIITNANVHATLNLEQRLLGNITLDIPDNCQYIAAYVHANLLGYIVGTKGHNSYPLLNKGVIKILEQKGSGWRDYTNGISFTVSYNKEIDALRQKINSTSDWYLYSRRKTCLCDNDNITCLKHWNNFSSTYYSSEEMFNPKTFHIGSSQGPLIVRIVYRATILVDVTEENINNVYFKSGYIAGSLGGALPNIVSPKVGDTAGTTEGWKEVYRVLNINSSANAWKNETALIALRNVAVEYAEFKVGYYNMTINPDVLVVSPTKLRRTNGAAESEVYHIASVTGSTIADIIGNSKSIFEYGGNLYRNVGGYVKPLVPLVNTTSNRPANPSIGEQFFDKTISKPIWWNGTAWVDATGATV